MPVRETGIYDIGQRLCPVFDFANQMQTSSVGGIRDRIIRYGVQDFYIVGIGCDISSAAGNRN